MILYRYLNRELTNMMVMIIFILLLIIITNIFVRYVSNISIINIEVKAIFKIIFLMLPKYISYLLPISLFFSILLVYGQLFANHELTIFFSSGNNWIHCLKILMTLAIPLVIIELFLTLMILPKMDHIYFLLKKTISTPPLINCIQPGKMVSFNKANQVLYTQSTDNNGKMKAVFICQKKDNNTSVIITALEGYSSTRINDEQYLTLKDGYYYEITPGNLVIQKGHFQTANQIIFQNFLTNTTPSVESLSTWFLLKSNNKNCQAQLQWRLSFPIAIFIATLIGLTFCKLRPCQNRYSRIILALLVFIIYFNLLLLSKSWTSQGLLPVWMGLWWVHLLFSWVMLFILKKYNGPLWVN